MKRVNPYSIAVIFGLFAYGVLWIILFLNPHPKPDPAQIHDYYATKLALKDAQIFGLQGKLAAANAKIAKHAAAQSQITVTEAGDYHISWDAPKRCICAWCGADMENPGRRVILSTEHNGIPRLTRISVCFKCFKEERIEE